LYRHVASKLIADARILYMHVASQMLEYCTGT
jgi:hypothetical protein